MKFGCDDASSFKGANLITFILSNDFDYLILQLKRQLYAKSNILTRKLLVVPGDEPLSAFEKSCLDDPSIGLNFGYRSINLNLAVEVIAKTLFQKVRFPKKKALRQNIIELLLKKIREDDPRYREIKKYLDTQTLNLNFFNVLASNFSNYALLGMDSDIPDRLMWQKILLEDLSENFEWPKNLLIYEELDLVLAAGLEIHFFGLSMIPPTYLEFFKKISRIVPCYFYVPTPSRVLALDYISDSASEYFSDSTSKNPLIANFQAGLKPLIKFFIDESSVQIDEFFLGREELSKTNRENGPLCSLKEALTLSILDAKVYSKDGKQKVKIQDDICIFKAPNPYREVEEAVEKIKYAISTHRLQLDEIVILSPNLDLYAPLLSYHLERNHLSYRIDASLFMSQDQAELSCFLNSINSRMSSKDLSLLLGIDTVSKRLGFSDKEVKSLKRIINSSGITFGYDSDHRLSILKNCEPQDLYIGTVSHFFDQIYLGSVFSNQQLKSTFFGDSHLAIDQRLLECLGEFHQLLNKINEFRNKLVLTHASLREFIGILIDFLMDYFDEEIVLNFRNSFQDELDKTLNAEYPGEIFFSQVLEKLEENKQGYQSKEVSKINCLEFSEGNYLGKKLIYVLGADESHLPKIQEKNSLDLSVQDGAITPLQMQKATFLHLIGLNSPYLYFSYSEIGFDKKDKILSLYVEKLIQYLDLYFETEDGKSVSSQIIQTLEEFSFDPLRFEKRNFDQRSFQLYLASIEKKRAQKNIQIQNLEPDLKINLKDLELLLKNPVRFFVKNSLNIHLPFDEDKKEFDLPSYKRKKIIFDSILEESEKYFKQLRYRGTLPQYVFAHFYESQLKKDCQNLKKKTQELTRTPNQIRKFELRTKKTKLEQISKNKYLLPAIKVNLNCGKSVEIEGEVSEFSPGVLMLPQETKQDSFFQFWPKILAYSHCSKLFQEKHLKVLGIDGKELNLVLEDYEGYFKDLVEYYFLAQKQISFFYDSSIKNQIKASQAGKSLDSTIFRKKESDPYFQFFDLNDSEMDAFASAIQRIYDAHASVLFGKGVSS